MTRDQREERRKRYEEYARRVNYMRHPLQIPQNCSYNSEHRSSRKRMRVRVYCIREAEAIMWDMMVRGYEGVQNDSYRYCKEAAERALESGKCWICNGGASIIVANSHFRHKGKYLDVSVSKFFKELDNIKTLNDVALCKHIRECCHEIHEDGKCFVYPFRYEKFVEDLNIQFGQDFDAHICTDGNICFDLRDVCDLFADDQDSLYNEIIKEAE